MVNRAPTMFAVLALVLLFLGISASRWASSGISYAGRLGHYGVGFQVPCYALAAWFSLCALTYSTPFAWDGKPWARHWHFWLSVAGVFIAVAGFAGTTWQSRLGYVNGTPYASERVMLASMIAMFFAGPAVLTMAQLFLLAGFVHRRGGLPHIQ